MLLEKLLCKPVTSTNLIACLAILFWNNFFIDPHLVFENLRLSILPQRWLIHICRAIRRYLNTFKGDPLNSQLRIQLSRSLMRLRFERSPWIDSILWAGDNRSDSLKAIRLSVDGSGGITPVASPSASTGCRTMNREILKAHSPQSYPTWEIPYYYPLGINSMLTLCTRLRRPFSASVEYKVCLQGKLCI